MTTQDSLPRFWTASVRLLQDPSATLAEVRVEAAIASYWHTHGESFPGIRKLAKMVPIDRRGIQRALRALEERGYIQTEARKRDDGGDTSSRYIPVTPRRVEDRPPGGTDTAPPAVLAPPNLRSRDLRSSESTTTPTPSGSGGGSSSKKKPRKTDSRWIPSQVIDAYRKAANKPDFSPTSGPAKGALRYLANLDSVNDLDEYMALVVDEHRKRKLTLTFRSAVNAAEWIYQTVDEGDSQDLGPAYQPWKGISNGAGK